MKTIGIIAEYNPFHRGHAYQIETVRKMTGADYIVVVMSGNFVQRGAPAWTDKYLRTQMALEGGADIIFELPTVYATASAEYFSLGAVSLLHQLGFVDALCFGCECADLSLLSQIADFLSAPDDGYQKELTAYLRTGLSYPAAREKALSERFPKLLQRYPSLLSAPNTILGIEYLKALRKLNSQIKPIPILRTDGGYHETKDCYGFLSASGIRKTFADAITNEAVAHEDTSSARKSSDNFAQKNTATKGEISENFIQNPLSAIEKYVPKCVQQILNKNTSHFPIMEDDFSTMIYYRLRTATQAELLSISDMTPDLYHRIRTELPNFCNVNDFIARIKTKTFTYSRISRVLFHVLLDIKTEYMCTTPLYANLLGFRKPASGLLRSLTEIPIITKAADADRLLMASWQEEPADKLALAQKHWNTDLLADDLYRQIVLQKYHTQLPDRFHASIITMK